MQNPLVFQHEFESCRMAIQPCPCGNYGHPEKDCLCTPHQVRRYRSKISQPLLDRIDIHLEVPALKMAELTSITSTAETSSTIRERVLRARNAQKQRFKGQKIHCNAKMGPRHLKAHCRLDPMGEQMLKAAIERLGMSARAYDRVLKVARTIADLEGKPNIESVHIGEAIGYRGLDRA
jgi:magnesium chelatase family protein